MSTPKGWSIVTPQVWYFRMNQLADKVQTVEGYADVDAWIDCTRALYMAELWEEDPGITPAMLNAKANAKTIDNWNVVIRPNEVVVGLSANDEHGIMFDPIESPEVTFRDLYNEGFCYIWDSKKKEKVKLNQEHSDKIEKFMKCHNHQEKMREVLPEMLFNMYYPNYLRWWEPLGGVGTRVNYDWDWLYGKGNKGIIEEIDKTIDMLERELASTQTESIAAKSVCERLDLMKACKLTMEVHMKWFRMYADKASELLEKEKDEWQRKRLQRIADSCDWLVENPPRNLMDALQSFEIWWEAGAHMESCSHSINMRIDQVWGPYYKKDVLEEKTLTHREAADMLACTLMKMCEHGQAVSISGVRLYGQGTRDYIACVIGGQTANGDDAWNELCDVILDVMDGYRLHYPDIKVRWHKKFKRENIKRANEVMRTGMGLPSWKNDEVIIPMMLETYGDEITMEEARSYAIHGCITPGATINSKVATARTATYEPIAKYLESTLFNGRDPEPGYEWVDTRKYIDTGDPRECQTFDDFYNRFLEQHKWFNYMDMKLRNMIWDYRKDAAKRTLATCGIERCVKEGVDNYDLDVPKFSFYNTVGVVDSVDSLVAMKYWIFDKKKYTMSQVIDALKAEWVGYEEMRQDMMNAPKYGNDNDYADEIMVRFINDLNRIAWEGAKDQRGKVVIPNGLIITTMFACAPKIGALPNGRKRGEALCDGSLNPHGKFDKAGAWARLRSALKVDQTKYKSWIYNQKLMYSSVEGDAGLEKLTDYIETAMRSGQEQIQINFTSQQILEDAQKHPEKHPLLSVRISGYSAYFVSLPKFVQDAVIQRGVQAL